MSQGFLFLCLAQILSNNSNNIKNNKPLSRLMLNLTKLHLTVSKSLLTQELLGCAWVFSDIVKQLEQLINNLHNCL